MREDIVPGGPKATAVFVIHKIPLLFIIIVTGLWEVSEVAIVVEAPETNEAF